MKRYVYSRDGKTKGYFTGGERPCFAGCPGFKKAVRWENGKLTYVCTTDLVMRKGDEPNYQLRPHQEDT